jgi:protease I
MSIIGKHILLVIAHTGYQPIEYSKPLELLKKAGAHVSTASNKPQQATASDKSRANVDVTLENIDVNKYDGIFFIGGPDALENLDNPESYRILRETAANNIAFGAICISPRILAKAGVLKDKKATGWDEDQNNPLAQVFNQHRVTYVQKGVVIDGNIVTAQGPHYATEFGQAIISLFADK